jgi:hypothetical protein
MSRDRHRKVRRSAWGRERAYRVGILNKIAKSVSLTLEKAQVEKQLLGNPGLNLAGLNLDDGFETHRLHQIEPGQNSDKSFTLVVIQYQPEN